MPTPAPSVGRFREGEQIWTESSYKYEPSQIEEMGEDAGFTNVTVIDDDARFALTLFEASHRRQVAYWTDSNHRCRERPVPAFVGQHLLKLDGAAVQRAPVVE